MSLKLQYVLSRNKLFSPCLSPNADPRISEENPEEVEPDPEEQEMQGIQKRIFLVVIEKMGTLNEHMLCVTI